MKKILIIVSILFLVGCGSNSTPAVAPAQPDNQEVQSTEKDDKITELEAQVQSLTDSLSGLQGEYDALQAAMTEKETEAMATDEQASTYLCDAQLANMKYDNPYSSVAILDGWFALQPDVQELQGTFSTQFWDGIQSRIHTIRYISEETSLTTTESFLLFFEEAEWQEGLLSLTNQCWLDFPY